MKTFKNWIDIINYSEGIDNELTIFKFNHKDSIIIKHADRTELKLVNFKLEKVKYLYSIPNVITKKNKIEGEIVYIIYTEHHGVFQYCESDLKTKPEIIFNYRKKK